MKFVFRPRVGLRLGLRRGPAENLAKVSFNVRRKAAVDKERIFPAGENSKKLVETNGSTNKVKGAGATPEGSQRTSFDSVGTHSYRPKQCCAATVLIRSTHYIVPMGRNQRNILREFASRVHRSRESGNG